VGPAGLTLNPESLAVDAGDTAELSVDARVGSPPLSFQWRKNGEPINDTARISGATTDTLTFDPALPEDTDFYDVVVSNASGSETSMSALLGVRTPEGGPCNAADLAQPFGLLDGADVNAFITAFGAGCP